MTGAPDALDADRLHDDLVTALGATRAYAGCAFTMAQLGDTDAALWHAEAMANAARRAEESARHLRKARLLALARRAKAIREPQPEEAAHA